MELLAYRPPGRSAESAGVTDLASDWITLAVAPAVAANVAPLVAATVAPVAATVAPLAASQARVEKYRAVTDPDGHRLVITDAARA